MTEIPIRNLFYFLCYAWNILDQADREPMGSEQVHHPIDLLGYMLNESCQKLVKRGLTSEYVRNTEILSGIKGKIQIVPTIQKSYHRTGRMMCETDEYSPNNLPNQILRSTLFYLSGNSNLSREIKNSLINLEKYFYQADLRPISDRDFRSVHIHRQNRHYAMAIRLCELIWQELIPNAEGNHYSFQVFDRNEHKMRTLFESFVRNFYKKEAPHYQVSKSIYQWSVEQSEMNLSKNYLPELKTDIVLKSTRDHLIIETKFVPEIFSNNPRSKEKLQSNHLYQLMSYLENFRRTYNITPRGILLYPTVGEPLNVSYKVWDMDVQIFTIDLSLEWQEIHRGLLGLVEANGHDKELTASKTS